MSWLRLDDKFAQHPKVAELSDRAFRDHVTAMLYAAGYNTEGTIPKAALRVIGCDPKTRAELVDAGVWEEHDDTLRVHDFLDYNGRTAIEREQARLRKQAERARRPRDTVTPESRPQSRSSHAPERDATVPESVTGSHGEKHGEVTPKSRPPARASRPVPKEQEHQQDTSPRERPAAAEPDLDALEALLGELGWSPAQQDAAAEEPARALAWLERARVDPSVALPGAFAWSLFSAGGFPTEPRPTASSNETKRVDPSKRCEQCGATLGEGHLEGCSRLAAAAQTVADEPVSTAELERRAQAATSAAGLLRSLEGSS